MSLAAQIAQKDFSRKTLAGLGEKGISVIGATFVPGPSGSYLDGERAYSLDDNGTHRLRAFLEVLTLAEG